MAPILTPSPVIRRASELGCTLDCDLLTGLQVGTGGTPTDNTAIINNWLAGATQQTPLKLIVDGGCLVTGVIGPASGHWAIEGAHATDTGFYVKAGSNSPAIRNGATLYMPSDPSYPSEIVSKPARGSNVHISSLFLNGNRGSGYFYPTSEQKGGGSSAVGNGNSNGPDARGNAADFVISTIDLVSLDHVTIDNVTVSQAPAYSIRISNVGFANVTRCNIQPFYETQSTNPINADGIHINGPSNDIVISGCRLRTGDDPFALNAVEGYYGTITRVTITGCILKECPTLLRLYPANTQNSYSIDNVVYSGNVGQGNCGLCCGIENNPGGNASVTDAIGSILFVNNVITTNYFCFLMCNIGSLTIRGNTINITSTGTGVIMPAYRNITVSSLSFTQNTVYRYGGKSPTALFDMTTGFFGQGTGFAYTFKQILIDGFAVHDQAGTSYGNIANLINSGTGNTINQLHLGIVDSARITALCNTPAIFSAGAVSGAGVLPTGWQVPDAAMANNVPFVSATSGVPSIMIGGTRKTIGLS